MFRVFMILLVLSVAFSLESMSQGQHTIAIDDRQQASIVFTDESMEITILSAGQTHRQHVDLVDLHTLIDVTATDYNGDGYADFSLQFSGRQNHTPHHWRIFLFQPGTMRFQEARIPEKYRNRGVPMGFWNPYFFEEERILFSRADYLAVLQDKRKRYHQQGWKFTIQGPVYLAESLRPVERDDPWTTLLPLTAVHTIFGEAGDTTRSGVVFMFSPTDDMEPVVLPVEQERLYLHDAPQAGKRSAMYLIRGDEYEVLDYLKGGWLKIRYVNPSHGNIDKYITVMEASSNRLDFYREVVRENEGLELTIGELGTVADSVYAALLYMGAKNAGSYAKQFDAVGTYLLYRPKNSDDPYRVWQVSDRRDTFPLPELGEVSMWADNFVVWEQDGYVLDGTISGGLFLPTDMETGDYEYRIVMASDSYDLALISNAATLSLPLPKVVWDTDREQYVVQPEDRERRNVCP